VAGPPVVIPAVFDTVVDVSQLACIPTFKIWIEDSTLNFDVSKYVFRPSKNVSTTWLPLVFIAVKNVINVLIFLRVFS